MEKYKFSKAGENLVNLMIDHKRNAPLACFASKEGRKEAINAKFFEVLGTSNPSENDLDEHKKEIFAILMMEQRFLNFIVDLLMKEVYL